MATKKGFFQKPDQKKQYSENLLSNVDSAYRPKGKGRVRNPISSNTMSGEEAETFDEPLTQLQESAQHGRYKNPVGYAFAGPQAKRQKRQAQAESTAPTHLEAETPVAAEPAAFEAVTTAQKEVVSQPEIQVRTGAVPKKKKSEVAIQKSTPKKSKKLSEPEIRVRTGNLVQEESQPEIQVRTGNPFFGKPVAGPTLETTVAFELLQAAIMLEAMQELEADVQETKGNYEPVEATEVQAVKTMGNLFFKAPAPNPIQYELDFDSIDTKEFEQSEPVEQKSEPPSVSIEVCQQDADPSTFFMSFSKPEAAQDFGESLNASGADLYEEPLTQEASAAELGLSFDPQSYRKEKTTAMLNVPKQGIKRSNRGTIEAVFQPNGNVVKAQYNRCGILTEVKVGAAMKLTRSARTGDWTMSYCDGSQPVNRISNVAFDRLGNLCFCTEDGHTTVICADGSVVEK